VATLHVWCHTYAIHLIKGAGVDRHAEDMPDHLPLTAIQIYTHTEIAGVESSTLEKVGARIA